MVPVVPPAATVRSSDALKLGDSPAIVPLYWPSRAVGPVTPESFLHAAPDATSTSAVALRSRLTGRMGMPSFVESVIRRSRGARARDRPCGSLPLSRSRDLLPSRHGADPHDSAPRGSWHLSCVPICTPAGRAQARDAPQSSRRPPDLLLASCQRRRCLPRVGPLAAQRRQLGDEPALRGNDLLECHRDREPLGAVNLGELLLLPRLRRPFQRKQVAVQLRRIAVAFHRPCVDYLPTTLRDRRKRDERALGSTAGLFRELTLRGRQWFFARLELALGNRPSPLVLLRPKRSSRMHQEHLRLTVPEAKHQEPCAGLRHLLPPRCYFCHTAYPSLRSSRANTHSMRCASA